MTKDIVSPECYAAWRQSPLGATTERLEKDLVFRLAGPMSAQQILDVGTGDGAYAIEAAARGAKVVGLDADPAMLREAERRAVEEGVSVGWHEGRAENMPFEDGAFDLVLAVTVLCFVDARAALTEVSRVLAPGGRLVLGELGRWSSWAALRRVRGAIGRSGWRAAQFRSASEMRNLLQSTGFEVEQVEGAIYYPPWGAAAKRLSRLDFLASHITTVGAAFIAASAHKNTKREPVELDQ